MNIGIIGVGGVGGYFGAKLCQVVLYRRRDFTRARFLSYLKDMHGAMAYRQNHVIEDATGRRSWVGCRRRVMVAYTRGNGKRVAHA